MTDPRPADGSAPEESAPQLLDLLRDVTEYADAIGEAALADTALSLSASGLLIAICHQPGITIAQISRQIPKTQQTIGQVVARLHKLGLIERRLGDGRGIALHPTAAGRDVAGRALAGEAAAERQLHSILGRDRHRRLVAALTQAHAVLRDAVTADDDGAAG